MKTNQDLMNIASEYVNYGPSYNRHIATTYHHIESCQRRGFSESHIAELFKELEIRLNFWVPRMTAGE